MKNLSEDDDFVLVCNGLSKTYGEAGSEIKVLSNIDFSVRKGERIAVMGTSGSGKTTLLNLLGGLDFPSAGAIHVAGVNLSQVGERELNRLRNFELGFVYQFHHLLGEFTALENTAMPLLIRGLSKEEAKSEARAILENVGLASRLTHKPAQLSGGERQRVAIARALVGKPRCVLMDEPTGNLDRKTAVGIHSLLNELNASLNTSFIIVTHDEMFASSMDRCFFLIDAKLTI
ncbi:ATP-binding cassette domain-containing protein [OM182 bacterium]|nr:ATP-binding cassette domain-containing protein [OM182 bacterium]